MNWLTRSHQRWKLYAGFVPVAAAAVSFVAGLLAFGKCDSLAHAQCATATRGSALMLAGTGLGVAGFIWLCLSVRCPKCGTRVIWWAMSKKASGAWLAATVSLQTCPKCGGGGGG